MRKNLFYLFALICSMGMFMACSEDDPDYTQVIETEIAGSYKGELNVNVDGTDLGSSYQKITVEKAGAAAINLYIKDFSFLTIPVGDVDLLNCPLSENNGTYTFTGTTTVQVETVGLDAAVDAQGSVADGQVSLNLSIKATLGESEQNVTVTFEGVKLNGTEGTEADIRSFTFGSAVVSTQPVIDGTNITFNVLDGVDVTSLAPTIEVSAGATVTPASGVAQDFTNPVTYTVVSEDYATTKTYTVSVTGSSIVYNFETWVAGVEGQSADMTFYEPSGWSSSNTGAHMLKAMSYTDSYVVMETSDAHSGKKAALIKSIDSKGGDMIIAKVPKVTTGSLFLGTFITDITSTLSSTKFGIPFDNVPVSLKGWYKYTPGTQYYSVTETPYEQHCHEATLDEAKSDEFMISVVLYETEAYDTENWSDCLTGSATTEQNIYTSSRVAAIGQLTGGEQTEWTEFTLPLEWKKEYNADTNYRMAIICSSSKDGDKFSGAPESTLIVDDFELIIE